MIVLPKINFLNRYAQKLQKNETTDVVSQNSSANRVSNSGASHIYIYDVLKNDTSFKGADFGTNLTPLKEDTVSFGSAAQKKGVQAKTVRQTQAEKDAAVGKVRKEPKARNDKHLDPSDRTSMHLAESVREEVDFAYRRLKNDISSIFGMRVLDVDDRDFSFAYDAELLENITNQKPVLAITSRKKSAKSIAEKMGHMKLSTKKGALENIHDIAGIRILVSNSDKKSGEYVADKLLKAVKNGWIKISEIEIYRNPDLTPVSKFDYISEKKLDQLAAASRQKVKDFEYTIRKTEFGYSAIHLRVDLPGDIKGEIQIIGPGVAAFKEIEDICYKGLSGKGLPVGYRRLKPAFDRIDPKVNKKGYDEFAAYTRAAYAHERMKRSRDKDGPFLSIPPGSSIPQRLDFNNIAKLRNEIEDSKRAQEAQKMREEAAKLIDKIGAAQEE